MVKKSVVIQLASGLEARPVAMLVQVASQFESEIYILLEGKRINAKSIMGMMTLGLSSGSKMEVEASGSDEQAAVDKIEAYLSGKE